MRKTSKKKVISGSMRGGFVCTTKFVEGGPLNSPPPLQLGLNHGDPRYSPLSEETNCVLQCMNRALTSTEPPFSLEL